jgi:phospholipid/cholesterol/gamma-HCH transport system substrate-binding protein
MEPDDNQSMWTAEFKVGLMTISALLVLMFAILFVKNFNLTPGGYKVIVTFNFLGDLKPNAPVKYAGGIDVGKVDDIRMHEGKAACELLITLKDFKLRKDSIVTIYTAGMLGSKYVQVAADLGKGEELKPGEVLAGLDSNNLDQTLSRLGDVMEAFEYMMGDPKAKENFLHSFENMNKATDNLLALSVSSRAHIDKILADLSRSSGNADKVIQSAERVSKSLEDLTASLNKKDISQSMKNLNATLKVMNELSTDIQNGKGTLGVLLKDEKTAEDIRRLVAELKAHPWKLLWKQ